MYKIIHVDKSWIVCDGQAKLIAFERRSMARRAAHDADELLHDEASPSGVGRLVGLGRVLCNSPYGQQ